jgi:hypothetical protein
LYLATLTEVHTFDALSYVTSVERKPWTELFHPHHLAYGPLGALALAAGELLGYGGGATRPLQLVNATAGALGVALLFGIARRVTGRLDAALAAALLLGGAYAYWYYAVEVEVYTVAALLLIVCLDLLTRPGAWTAQRTLALGVAQGGAVLFHQTNVLLCVPVLVVFVADWWASSFDGGRTGGAPRIARIGTNSGRSALLLNFVRIIRRGVPYVLALAITVGAPYLWVMLGVSGFRSWDRALAWLTEYARTGWWGGPLNSEKVIDLGQGLANTLAQPGGALLWLALGVAAVPWGRNHEGTRARRQEDAEELKARAKQTAPLQRTLLHLDPLVAWLFVYGVFFTWWEPDNVEFWIASLPPLLLLLALSLGRGRPWGWRSMMALGVAGAALVINYGSIERRGDPATDLQRVVARELVAQATPADLLAVPDGLLELYLLHYEGHENFTSLNQALFDAGGSWDTACERVRERVGMALHAGATAFFAQAALQPPDELLARHRISQAQVDACFAPYRGQLVLLVLPDTLPVYARLPRVDELADGAGWRFDAFDLGWHAANIAGATFDGGWRFRPETDAALVSPLMHLDTARYTAIEVRMANGTAARDAQIFFAGADGAIDEERSVRWSLAATNEPTTYTIPLRGTSGWEGIVTRLRFDPVGVGDGGEVRVEWVRLVR